MPALLQQLVIYASVRQQAAHLAVLRSCVQERCATSTKAPMLPSKDIKTMVTPFSAQTAPLHALPHARRFVAPRARWPLSHRTRLSAPLPARNQSCTCRIAEQLQLYCLACAGCAWAGVEAACLL